MSSPFPTTPSPYSISPDAYVALSKLSLQNPGQAQGAPVSSVGLSQGTPAVQSSTQAALQQALANALGSPGLGSMVSNFTQNPQQAQQYAGSVSQGYVPQQPSGAWRLNSNTGAMLPLFSNSTPQQIVAPNAIPTPAPVTPAQQTLQTLFSDNWPGTGSI